MSQPVTPVTKDQYIDAVRTNSALLARAARLGLNAPVPTCPGWYVATLVAHIGEVQHFWAHQIRTRAQEPKDLPRLKYDLCPGLFEWYQAAESGDPDLNSIPHGILEWFEGASHELVNAFVDIKPDVAVWHWSGDNRAITHMRNQAMEATVHRWDAQNAHSVTSPIDAVIALDGIEQHFEVQIAGARKWGKSIQGSGERFHFHRTDGDGEWLVRFEGDAVEVWHEHAKGDIAVRGALEDLFLWLWGRIPAERLDVFGDRSLLDRYRQLVPSG